MDEYINREAVYEDFEKCNSENPKWTPSRVKTLVARQKAADVAPVRHGRWMKAKNKKDYWGFDSDGDFGCWSDYPVLCSSCKYDATENSTGETNYCPNCGAKMDGGGTK